MIIKVLYSCVVMTLTRRSCAPAFIPLVLPRNNLIACRLDVGIRSGKQHWHSNVARTHGCTDDARYSYSKRLAMQGALRKTIKMCL